MTHKLCLLKLFHALNKNIINFDRQAATAECSTISDIVDGSIYREFLQSAQGKCVLRGNGFTLSLNTDGADPSDKSTISLWPVFLVINEIPLEKRYCIENIIIAGKFYYSFNIIVAGADSVIYFKGLSIGDSKPDFQVFIEPIVEKLLELQYSFEITDRDKNIKRLRCFLLYGIYDKPARALANNIINSNGYYGCCKCLQEGERLRNSKSKLYVYII